MDKIDRLKIFCLVAQKQSFSQAAMQLGIPRSNVTYAVQSIEKEYEVLLFYRTTRKVTLTYEGSLFYEETSHLISQLKELNHFKLRARGQEGKIRIGMASRLATQILLPNIMDFYQRYPKIKILINSTDDYSNLIEQQLDCVVRIGQAKDQYLVVKPITHLQIWTVASPKYILEFGEPKKLEELKQHIAVDYQTDNHYKEWSRMDFYDQQVFMPYRLLTQNTETYIQAGLAGGGIIQIPSFDAIPYIKEEKLYRLFSDIQCQEIPVNILLTDRKYRPKYLQDFIDWLSTLLVEKL